MTSAAWRRFHTGCNFFTCFMFFTIVFNVDTKFPTAMPGQHMFQYVHQLLPKYLIACHKQFLVSFIHISRFAVKLCSVHNIIWFTKLTHNSRPNIHGSTPLSINCYRLWLPKWNLYICSY
jgi:hypothetical protein